jgi:hypothetical protein
MPCVITVVLCRSFNFPSLKPLVKCNPYPSDFCSHRVIYCRCRPSQRSFYILEVKRAEDVENYVGAVERVCNHTDVRKIVRSVPLGYLIHTLSYNIPTRRQLPLWKGTLPHGQCSVPWARNCKRGPRLIPPAYVAWQAGTTNRLVVPGRQAWNQLWAS